MGEDEAESIYKIERENLVSDFYEKVVLIT